MMVREYIEAAMQHAHYEMIDQPGEPYYGEIPPCPGVQVTGGTLEECRSDPEDALDAWLVIRLQHRLDILEIAGLQPARLTSES